MYVGNPELGACALLLKYNCIPRRRRESDTLSPGNAITTVETPFGVIGVGICYDIRFPELSMAMRAAGAVLVCFPGAFNMTTGPAHWELLQRARALDNQVEPDATKAVRAE